MPWRNSCDGPLRFAAGATRGAVPLRAAEAGWTAPLSASPVQPTWQQLAPAAGTQ